MSDAETAARPTIAIIGAGPAGLMAAEVLAGAGHRVTIYERMPSPGRKLLMAGRGGLNLTHSEPLEEFLTRYGTAAPVLSPAVAAMHPAAVVAWAEGLGQETFTGSSGRIFPKAMKASPLLRAWLGRLDSLGVEIKTRQRWIGWGGGGALRFEDAAGQFSDVVSDATLLALGGASWPRLGTDGSWVEILVRDGVPITPLAAANAGIRIPWSEHVAARFAGTPLKRISVSIGDATERGEAMITRHGLEGGVIYALSRAIRTATKGGAATLTLDLKPDDSEADLALRLAKPRGKMSTANFLRKAVAFSPAAIALLRETGRGAALPTEPAALAHLIKHVPLTVTGLAGLERAISTAGGVRLDAIDGAFMLKAKPGVFVAGEMLDWDAPTGGYLLQACFATGAAAARGMMKWVARDGRGTGAT